MSKQQGSFQRIGSVDDAYATRSFGSPSVPGGDVKESAVAKPRELSPDEQQIAEYFQSAETADDLRSTLLFSRLTGVEDPVTGQWYTKDALLKTLGSFEKYVGEGKFDVVEKGLENTTAALGFQAALKKLLKQAREGAAGRAIPITREQPVVSQEEILMHELTNRFKDAQTFNAIRQALVGVVEVPGSLRENKTRRMHPIADVLRGIRSAELLPSGIPDEQFDDLMRVHAVTSEMGLRKAVLRAYRNLSASAQEEAPMMRPVQVLSEMRAVSREQILQDRGIPLEQRLLQTQTFEEIELALGNEGISGSSAWHSPFELKQMIVGVRGALQTRNADFVRQAVDRVTSGGGLRDAVSRMAFQQMRAW